MTSRDPIYITTTIPYVNARPHIGHALELVQADVLARHYRRRGHPVRYQTGTDDNSLKNVLAAHAQGIGVRELVARNAAAFSDLAAHLSLSVDDEISTSSDVRHKPGVHRLWRACDESGDIYRKHYAGLYCVGCEQFYHSDELIAGRCAEHGTQPELISEENWFFRLSAYADQLRSAILTGKLRIEPAGRRNEVLSFIEGGLTDFSISRSATRARGWGVPVPDDPSQVIYVWFDALGNYISALGYGSDEAELSRWWTNASRQIHLLGKDVLRFHAVYWPAILLSAGLPLPSDILVHDHLTADGAKISKSAGNTVDPVALTATYGTDALRWWLLRDVPRVGDTDFTLVRLIARSNDELANGIGNLVNRVVALIGKYRDGVADRQEYAQQYDTPRRQADQWRALSAARAKATGLIDAALAGGDFRKATAAVWAIVDHANRYVSHSRPWDLAKAELAGDRDAGRQFDAALGALIATCREVAGHLEPFLPDASARIAAQCASERLPAPVPLFPRLCLLDG
ncbi:MAG TPA: methionine--tRNA ligase [Streptosporangiaceae bacterium]|nr:methionine--tRNA ligase [Streptosporangiaceae bacterium]